MTAFASHHRRLERRECEETARLLVLARGYHGAVDACLRNGREDILALICPQSRRYQDRVRPARRPKAPPHSASRTTPPQIRAMARAS